MGPQRPRRERPGRDRAQATSCPRGFVELPLPERAAVIRAYLLRWGRRAGTKAVAREVGSFFGVGADASLDEIGEVAERYPVFRVEYPGRRDCGRGWGK